MKSILLIDTPKDCGECRLNSHTEYDFDVCWVTQGKGECPLRPLPEVRDEHYHCDNWELERIINAESRGFNWCIDEIMGEKE